MRRNFQSVISVMFIHEWEHRLPTILEGQSISRVLYVALNLCTSQILSMLFLTLCFPCRKHSGVRLINFPLLVSQLPWYHIYIGSSFAPAHYCVYAALLEILSETISGPILNLLLHLRCLLYELVCSRCSKLLPARWSHDLRHSQILRNRKGLSQFLKRQTLGIFVQVTGFL